MSENSGRVSLDWQIGAGNTCNGTIILHSIDSVEFNPIGEIVGICGSTTEPTNYTFNHSNPQKNRTNYYRLMFGGTGLSQTISIRVIDIPVGYLLGQNPFSNFATIYFANENKKFYRLSVYALNGNLLLTTETTLNSFQFSTQEFINGQYLFSIGLSSSSPDIKGKFLIQH
ncbi:MAG: hypothetical protein KA841_00050 [Chitinophagales bacterium]|nr:hypothetical protein [Chitinophagales bacterium]